MERCLDVQLVVGSFVNAALDEGGFGDGANEGDGENVGLAFLPLGERLRRLERRFWSLSPRGTTAKTLVIVLWQISSKKRRALVAIMVTTFRNQKTFVGCKVMITILL